MSDRLRPDGIDHPLDARLPHDPAVRAAILAAHAAAVERGSETYVDPRSRLMVLTAATLAARGTCCGSGCRHCPYEA